MKTIKSTITNFTEGKRFLSDVNPVVHDEGWCSVEQVNPVLEFEWDGCKSVCDADDFDDTIEILKAKAERTIAFNEWFEDHWTDSFDDIGVEAPVGETEEGKQFTFSSVDEFINEGEFCMFRREFEEIKAVLTDIAVKEIHVEWV